MGYVGFTNDFYFATDDDFCCEMIQVTTLSNIFDKNFYSTFIYAKFNYKKRFEKVLKFSHK